MKHLNRIRFVGLFCLCFALFGLTIQAHRSFGTSAKRETAARAVSAAPAHSHVATVPAAPLQAGGNFDLSKSVIAGGGVLSTGGAHELTGTAGQSAVSQSSGSIFTLNSGFWPGLNSTPCPTLTLTPGTLPNGTSGVDYSQNVTASGGAAPYHYVVTAGALPAGLSLSAAGVVSGTSTQLGATNFTITATDANSCTGAQAYTLTIAPNCPAITVNPSTLPSGATNTAYNQTLTATGGAALYSFAVTSGALPNGLTLSSAGALTGTPTLSGVFNFSITATDANACTGTRAYTLPITQGCPAITINPASLPNGTTGTLYNQQFSATGGVGTITFAALNGTFPPGLGLNANNQLAGTPTTPGAYNFTIKATDANGCLGTQSYAVVINSPASATLVVTSIGDTIAADGFCSLREAIQAANSNLAVNECSAGLPGLNTINFNIPGAGVQTIHLTSALPAITEPVVIDGYSQPGASVNTLANGDNAVLKIELDGSGAGVNATGLDLENGSSGSTVRGLAINRFSTNSAILIFNSSNNLVTGNFLGLDAAGAAAQGNQFGIRILSFNGASANNTIGGASPATRNVIAGNSSGGVLVGNDNSTNNTVEGNFIGTNAAGVVAQPNQPGVSIGSSGGNTVRGNVIAGNSFAGVRIANFGSSNNQVIGNKIGVSATGTALGNSGAGIRIDDGPTGGNVNNTIGGTTPGAGNVIANNTGDGVRIDNFSGFALTGHAILGNAIYANGGLGIDLNDDGVTTNDNGDADSGPNNRQNFPVLISVNAAGDIQGSLDSLAANTAYPVRIEFFANTACDASGNGAGEVYLGFTSVNGPGNFTAHITPIAGKPFITATATDANGNTSEFSACKQIITNTVPAITASAPITQQQGSPAANQPIATVADPDQAPNTLAVTATPLTGSGVTLSNLTTNAAGQVTASVTAACAATNSTFTLKVTDNTNLMALATLTVNVTASTLSITTQPASQTVNVGAQAVFTVVASSNTALSYQWRKNSVNINGATASTYTIASVVPSSAGNYDVVVTGACGSVTPIVAAVLTVNCPALTLTPASLPNGSAGTAYSQQLTASGGIAPYSFSLVAGGLPAGLTLSPAGLLAGNATQPSGGNITIKATDANGCTGTKQYSLTISCSTLTVNPASLPAGTMGAAYNQNLTQSGGNGAITFSMNPANVAGGLTLSAGGVLTGTPTQAGSFPFTVMATDANNCTGQRAYTLTLGSCPAITITPGTLPGGTTGASYNQALTPTGGTPSYTFSLNAGSSLPPGLSLSTAGLISGTPTSAGAFNFTIKVSDAAGCMTTKSYSLTVVNCAALTVNPASLPNSFVGTAYNQMFTATGGTAPYSYSVSAGALPGGSNLAAGGALAGTLTTPGTFNFTIKATDANGCLGTRAYTVIVSGNGLQFYPLAHPIRLLDTRPGQLGCDAPAAQIPGGTARTQTAAGRNCGGLSIPANAKALTGNITTVQSGGGYLTLYPSDAGQPLVANSNYSANEILNNVFTVGLGAGDGAFKIFVTSNTHLVVDVTGYYAPPGAGGLFFHPLPKPIRLLETRAGLAGCFTPGTPIQGGADTPQAGRLTCDGVTIPASAQALVGNATVVNAGGGYLTLWPSGTPRPLVASSNYSAGQVLNAPFTVGLGADGNFMIFATATTDLVVDVLGYYSAEASDANGAGLLFNPLPQPVRLLETRAGFTGCYTPNAPLLAGSTRNQQARGACSGVTIANNALAIVGNATVVNAQSGYLTFWPSSAAQPLVATTNFSTGQVLNRHFTTGLGADGVFKIFAAAQTELVIDVAGFFAP